jgi:glyoxylase-like metal-dependent hydrolase (beta-lactamase superfamily II)
MNGRLRFLCGEADRAWVESTERMVAEIYRWSEPYGFGPDDDSLAWLRRELDGDCPVDLGLRGGETLRLGPGWRIEVLHLPGHTPGHLGLWDERSGAAIIIDAALETGIYDRGGNRLIPPRFFDARGYARTIRALRALGPEHLLTAHYPPMRDDDALGFLDRSLDFVLRLAKVVEEGVRGGTTDLWELTQRADRELGPYPEFMIELGAGVRAHMALL